MNRAERTPSELLNILKTLQNLFWSLSKGFDWLRCPFMETLTQNHNNCTMDYIGHTVIGLQLWKVIALVLPTQVQARFVENKLNLIGIVGWFLTQVFWSAALGDFLSRLHALPLQNQSGSAGICHQWRKNGSTKKLSWTSVSISLLS